MYIILKLKLKHPYLTLLFLLISYEVFELATYGTIFILKESSLDIIWDLIVGMGGGVVAYYFTNQSTINSS